MHSDAYPSMRTLPDVGTRLKAMRKKTHKTQGQLAAVTGMRQEAISRFETGSAADFSLSKLLKLLEALDLELDFKPAVRRPTLEDLLTERHSQLREKSNRSRT